MSWGGNQANRGKPLEEMLTITNEQYRSQRRLVMHKVPTEWIPLRGPRETPGGIINAITGAKVEKEASVDYLGAYKGRSIAYEAKYVGAAKEKAIRWDRVEPHQELFMQDWQEIGQGISFILVGFQMFHFAAVPWDIWQKGLDNMRAGTGKKSINLKEFDPAWTVEMGKRVVLDYLTTVDRLFF